MTYIDANMIAVPSDKKEEYRENCKAFADWVMKEGALQVIDAWGDDVPVGETNCMNSAVLKKDDETASIGFIVWPDKATRDAAWGKMMSPDSDFHPDMVGDGKRMIFGGFETLHQS